MCALFWKTLEALLCPCNLQPLTGMLSGNLRVLRFARRHFTGWDESVETRKGR